MKKGQAIYLSKVCGVLTHSEQFDFGVLRVLLSNAKIQDSLSEQKKEIIEVAKTAKKTDEELNKELEKFMIEEFEGEFKKLPSSVNAAKYEVLENFTLGNEKFETLKGLMILENNNIIE